MVDLVADGGDDLADVVVEVRIRVGAARRGADLGPVGRPTGQRLYRS